MNNTVLNNFLYLALKIEVIFPDGYKKINTHGTGVAIVDDKGQLFVATNRHVIDIDYKKRDDKYKHFKVHQMYINCKLPTDSDSLPTVNRRVEIGDVHYRFSSKYENDIVVLFDINARDIEGGEFKMIYYHINKDMIADVNWINTQLAIGDMVAFTGYPEWHHVDESRPICRFGNISSDPRFNYSYLNHVSGECLVYEAFSTGGTSGSPVFAIKKGWVSIFKKLNLSV